MAAHLEQQHLCRRSLPSDDPRADAATLGSGAPRGGHGAGGDQKLGLTRGACGEFTATPSPSPVGPCCVCSQNSNKTCEECLKNVSCLWCNTNKACLDYPVRKILPPSSLCKLSSARWGVCWVNFEALIIAMSVVGGSIILGVSICCCCCCCKRKKSRKPDKSEERAMREREERRIRQEERRAEMKSRHDEIRKKYGLFKEENPYARFENN
ncbi:PREDICTED: pituitary tumor-transforming gene 1 protein-interacting protein [Elephantulus edwardii]|uniref:pituitary tumor-transforming gene 1 protein-interacting protein n=1 Tax=Elephantulus edwardii TaxID=28737 RepID=UPI0003F07BBF|nr:PREDICTED: pituitary tumor-transforming gene 1 protein-interacting protein [Elephantulus edwardii]